MTFIKIDEPIDEQLNSDQAVVKYVDLSWKEMLQIDVEEEKEKIVSNNQSNM